MNLAQIEVIVEIAKAGSISQAAQNLFISQPGVSKILQRFEEEMGVQIFERVSTGVRLTPVGRKFVASAQDIMEQVRRLEAVFGQGVPMVSIELSIASMSYYFMNQMLSELYNRYSQNSVNIKYVECGFDDQLAQISKGDVELGIVTLWQRDLKKMIKRAQAKGIEYHRLGEAHPYIAVSQNSKRYPREEGPPNLACLAQMPLISISPSAPTKLTGWDFMRQIFGEQKLAASGREITTCSTGTMREFVCRTDGFTLVLLNQGIYRRFGFFEDIRLIPYSDVGIQFELGWLQRANSVRSPLANEFIRVIQEYAAEE